LIEAFLNGAFLPLFMLFFFEVGALFFAGTFFTGFFFGTGEG
jgi:hypothetical protein